MIVSSSFVEEHLEETVRRVDEAGYDLIAIITTGVFRPFGARTPLIPDFSPRRPGVLNTLEVSLADDPRTYAYMEREVSNFLFELKGIVK